MGKDESEHGFMDKIKTELSYIPQLIFLSVFPKIVEGAEIVMENIDNRIERIEKRILGKLSHLLVIWLGGVLLILAVFSFLIEFLGWSNTAAYFSIGLVVFTAGIMLKTGEVTKGPNDK